jgi:predicted regulator of Ras-like GTPase activity (Roadblock/LC7/MglB family)
MFKEVLQSAIDKTECAVGAFVIGTDGIIVEKILQTNQPNTNLNIALAEYTSFLQNVRRTNEDLKIGKPKEITLTCESFVFLMRTFSENYLVAMVLLPNGNFGRGRYELYKAELLLEQEFRF